MFSRWLSISPEKSALILGPRRAGKTTLVKSLFSDWTYATLDDLDNLDFALKDPKGFVDSLGKRAVIASPECFFTTSANALTCVES